jgi:hypothetical protein
MGKLTISMAMFNSYLYVYQRVNNKFDLFEHVWHILLTTGWLWNPMISVILKVKLLWVCWSNPRKKRNPVTHSQKLLFCLLKPCFSEDSFFLGGKFPLKLLRLRVSSWSNSHSLVDKPCFCWLNTCDWCFDEFTIPSTNMLTLPWVFCSGCRLLSTEHGLFTRRWYITRSPCAGDGN